MTRSVPRLACVIALLAVTGAANGQAGEAPPPPATMPAADAELEARTTAVASRLRCPVCQGESIEDSPSELAREMRALVRDQLRDGKTPAEVEAYFVARYGEWILLQPTMTGLNTLLWIFPVFLVLGGLALVAALVRKWSAAKAEPPEGSG